MREVLVALMSSTITARALAVGFAVVEVVVLGVLFLRQRYQITIMAIIAIMIQNQSIVNPFVFV